MDANSLNANCITNEQNFVEYPIRSLKFLLKKLRIKELFKSFVHDPRSRIDNYELTSLLMHGLITHLFRSPSKNKFHLHLLRSNASRAVARFNGIEITNSPCTRTLDDVFIDLNPEDFHPILPSIFRFLCRQKVFLLHPEFIPQGEYGIAIDAQVTHTYYEHSQHPCKSCPYCLKRTRGDKVWYLHFDLVASFIAPNGLQIPLLFHRIRARPELGQLSDDEWKQECERTAFPILLLQCRGFAIRHDFNRAPNAQSIRIYLILIAYAISSILVHSAFGRAILARGYTISFMMEQMLTDLIYLSDSIWDCHQPFQLRFGKDPP